MKTCSVCGERKSLDDFHKRKDTKDGRQSQCKLCNIARVKKWQAENPERWEETWKRNTLNRDGFARKARRYNLPVEELQAMFAQANGKCQICGRKPLRWLVVDHCHKTLKVRGIICERCNQALGLFEDDIRFLQQAIEYLND